MNKDSDERISLSSNALKVLEKRYLKKDKEGRIIETPEKMFRRVATNVAAIDKMYGKSSQQVKQSEDDFYQIMSKLEFLPNSPTLMNAGTFLQQLSACFVLSIDDSIDSIYETIKQTALIHKSGGGTGFSFSRVRPKGSLVGTTSGVASGPVSFMKVFNASTEAIKQGGKRRGANIGILNVDHPDILEFITSKEKEGSLNNFNISVAASNEFMEAAQRGEEYNLIDPLTKKVSGKLNATDVLNSITERAWKNGEPGLIFLDRINQDNPTPLIGKIESTNPCGEQPLLPYESCNLGSINLGKMIDKDKINWEKLKRTVHTAVHFLDNVIDANKYPLPQIAKNTLSNRKIGLGVMGFADMLISLSIPYNSKKALSLAERVMGFIQDESKKASQNLAKERGTFPNFKGSTWEKEGLKLRNATTTTIAPTGSISMIANCSSGMEPLFSILYHKEILEGEKLLYVNEEFERIAKKKGFYSSELIKKILDHKGSCQQISEVPLSVRRIFVTAMDISFEDHIEMQSSFQKYIDNAVSKTINFPNEIGKEEVEKAFILAYKTGCKGITIYRDRSREEQVIQMGMARKKSKKEIIPRTRDKVTYGMTIKMETGCGDLYVTINKDSEGNPFEVFAQLGKSGGCAASQTEAIGRLVSVALRSGISQELIVRQLKGITCDRPRGFGKNKMLSCADAVAKAIELYQTKEKISSPLSESSVKIEKTFSENKEETAQGPGKWIGACPQCGSSAIEYEGGCFVCKSCGYTECE